MVAGWGVVVVAGRGVDGDGVVVGGGGGEVGEEDCGVEVS